MEKIIKKNIEIKIKIYGFNYCSKDCPLAKQNTCLLSLCTQSSNVAEIREENKEKHLFYRTDECRKICKLKCSKKNARSFLYQIPIETFYEIAYRSTNIKEAAKMLGTSEANLKWFLYNKIIDKNPERRNERILRICAFFDGQNDARKDKLKIKND